MFITLVTFSVQLILESKITPRMLIDFLEMIDDTNSETGIVSLL
jgi:hypothetical protein